MKKIHYLIVALVFWFIDKKIGTNSFLYYFVSLFLVEEISLIIKKISYRKVIYQSLLAIRSNCLINLDSIGDIQKAIEEKDSVKVQELYRSLSILMDPDLFEPYLFDPILNIFPKYRIFLSNSRSQLKTTLFVADEKINMDLYFKMVEGGKKYNRPWNFIQFFQRENKSFLNKMEKLLDFYKFLDKICSKIHIPARKVYE